MQASILLFAALLFAGCSEFRFSASLCDQVAMEPDMLAIPQECRNYDEEEASRAFFGKEHQIDDDNATLQYQNRKREQ